jgi:hypothetical protein
MSHSAAAAAAITAPPLPAYNEALRGPVVEAVGDAPRAPVHGAEWRKVLAGEPVEINPSVGEGFRVMSAAEWAARWKRGDFPACLVCGGADTREHHFSQTWCRGKRAWECESLCLGCHAFSWRSYADPDFETPEQHEKRVWS